VGEAHSVSAGVHAREWVAPATALFLATALLHGYGKVNATTVLLDAGVHVAIAPNVNPDGYVYAWAEDRLWRKNRRPAAANGGVCAGVDLNRNFDVHWGGVGASADPCATDYRGPAAASEPETQAVQAYVRTLQQRGAAVDLHAYGQYILRSRGWTAQPPPNDARLRALGLGMRDAMRAVSGSVYTSQRAAELYATTGSTDDWYTEQAGMLGWTIELRDEVRTGSAPRKCRRQR
jgi:murein tripeptide amidase MpaA